MQISITVKPDPTESDSYDVSSSITLTVSNSDQLVNQIRDGAIQVAGDGELTPARDGTGIDIGTFITQSWTPYLSQFTVGGASTSYSELDIASTSGGPFILTWSAPSWAAPIDTFKLSLNTPKLDILGVRDAAPTTEGVDGLTLSNASASAKISVAIGTANSVPAFSSCFSPFPCSSSQVSNSGSSAYFTDITPEYETVFDWIGWLSIGITFLVAGISIARSSRRIGIAILSVACTVSALFILRFDKLSWTVRLGNAWIDLYFLANEAAFVLLCSLPFLLARSPVGRPAWRRPAPVPVSGAAALIALLLSAQSVGYLALISRHTSIVGVVSLALAGAIAMGAGLRLLRVPLLGAAFAGVVLLWACLAQSDSDLDWLNHLLNWSIPASLGLAGAAVIAMLLDAQATRLSAVGVVALFIVFVVAMMPYDLLLYGQPGTGGPAFSSLYYLVLFLAADVMFVAALIVARGQGSTSRVYSMKTVRVLLLAAFSLFLALPTLTGGRRVGVCAAFVLLTFSLAVPASRAENAVQLSSGTLDERRALIIELAKQRVLQDRAKSVYREAVAGLAQPEAQTAEIENRAHAAVEVLTTTLDASVVERAFAAPPGTTPWRSGVTAAAIAAFLSVPFLWFALRGDWGDWLRVFNYDPAVLAVPFRLATLRAVFFAFIYGFYYPQLRGVTSLGKSVRFCAFILPADLMCTWLSQTTGGSLAKALTVEAAQQVMILMVLGAVWEFRAMRSAGLPWSVLRRFRGLHTLSGPVSAVLVAAVTAAVTTFVTSYARVEISPQSPIPTTSVSSTPTAGHGH